MYKCGASSGAFTGDKKTTEIRSYQDEEVVDPPPGSVCIHGAQPRGLEGGVVGGLGDVRHGGVHQGKGHAQPLRGKAESFIQLGLRNGSAWTDRAYQADEDEDQLDDVCVRHRVQAPHQRVGDGHGGRDPDADGVGEVQDHAHSHTCGVKNWSHSHHPIIRSHPAMLTVHPAELRVQ